MTERLYDRYLSQICEIPEFLKKYLETPSLKRLKNICYFCGMDYASKDVYNFKEKISRYDHSLDVALVTWKYTKNKTATIAALFHDVATPCFAHVIDYMNKDYANQESTEEYTEEIIKNDSLLQKYLLEDNIDSKDIFDFKKYSIVDNKRPKLCADRFDGLILTAMAWTKSIDEKDITEFVNDLSICKNEYDELELGFKTESTAKKAVRVGKEIDEFCHSNEDNYMMELLANITRKSINDNIITYKDLYYLDEETVIGKMKKSNNKELQQMINIFENVKLDEIPDTRIDNIKPRDLRPLCNGIRV